MKIYPISEYYKSYLYEKLDRISYPFENNGFNLSFISIDEQELFVFRNIFTYKSLMDKKIIPGIPSKNYTENFFNKDNISNNFFWNWTHYYESNILFVGKLNKDGKIIINKKIKPVSMINPTIEYKLPEVLKKIPPYFHSFKRQDFRLVNINNKIYMIDSMSNMLTEISIENNIIVFANSYYKEICQYNFKETSKNNNRYYKFYEKNWSIYKSYIHNNILNIYFLHDYDNIGIKYIHYNKFKCMQNYLLKYKKDIIPYDEDEQIRFSFGSSTIEIEKNIYLGVGHSKVFLRSKKINNNYIYLHEKSIKLHKELKERFKEKYKCHVNKMYYFYFFLVDTNKNSLNKFTISDSFIPVKLFDNYVFSLIFPMSIVYKYNKCWISCGYGDYTNILISFTLSEIKKKLIHNVENFDIKKYDLSLIYEK